MNDVTTRFIAWLNWLIANKIVKDAKNFALSIGVSVSSMTEISKGRTNVGLSIIQKTVLLYSEVNPAWLLTGEGEMLRSADGAPTAQQVEPTMYRDNPRDGEIIKLQREQIDTLKGQVEMQKEYIAFLKSDIGDFVDSDLLNPAVLAQKMPTTKKTSKKV